MTGIQLNTDATVPVNTTLDVIVHEDTDGDGIANNSVSQSISDGENQYVLSGFGASGDVWLEIDATTTDETQTAQLHQASVQRATLAGSVLVTTTGVLDTTSGVIDTQT